MEVEKKRQHSERKLLEEQKYKELKAVVEKAKVDGNKKARSFMEKMSRLKKQRK
jgi:hypothetical protein